MRLSSRSCSIPASILVSVRGVAPPRVFSPLGSEPSASASFATRSNVSGRPGGSCTLSTPILNRVRLLFRHGPLVSREGVAPSRLSAPRFKGGASAVPPPARILVAPRGVAPPRLSTAVFEAAASAIPPRGVNVSSSASGPPRSRGRAPRGFASSAPRRAS